MKFKTSAIALAVAGTVAAPMVAQADGSVYASARVGIVKTDSDAAASGTIGGPSTITVTSTGADSDQWQVKSLASRFGAKGETDLGNGMTGFGRYEWDVDLESGESIKIRHRYVGLKGDFGSVLLGQTYHTFYNFVVGPTDIPWWGSGYSMVAYVGRTGEAVTYAGGTGAINFGATVYMRSDSEEEEIDGTELGLSFGIGDMTLGVALKSEANDDASTLLVDEEEDILGIVLSGISFGDVSLGVGFQNQDENDSYLIHADIGNIYIHYEALSVDATDADPTTITLGYTHSLGRNTTAWFEVQSTDNDDNVSVSDDGDGILGAGDTFAVNGDFTVIRAMLKYDIL